MRDALALNLSCERNNNFRCNEIPGTLLHTRSAGEKAKQVKK
jgi:hypothetical protein